MRKYKNCVEYDESCCGCGTCVIACKYDAITMELTENGFFEPVVDNSKCIGCLRCSEVCSKFIDDSKIDNMFFFKDANVYASYSKDMDIRLKSSSGGIGSELAAAFLSKGYDVAGVAYDYENNRAKTVIIKDKNQLHQIRGSKYIQSFTQDALKAIVQGTDKKYIVFGTPCQIYGLRKYISARHIEDNFILVDLFCHGVPSYLLWNKYINEMKNKLNINLFDEVSFRNKANGWHYYSIRLKNGKKVYIGRRDRDLFFKMFFSDAILCKACYNCRLRGNVSAADLRIGDLWNKKFSNTELGISNLVAYNKKGEEALDIIRNRIRLEKYDISASIQGQNVFKPYQFNTGQYNKIMEELKTDSCLKEIYKHYKKTLTYKKKLINLFRNILSLLPSKMLMNIKSFIH